MSSGTERTVCRTYLQLLPPGWRLAAKRLFPARKLRDYYGGGHMLSSPYGMYESLAIRRKIGDRRGEATALTELGKVYHAQGRSGEAAACYLEGIVMWQDSGDRHGEAMTRSELAKVDQSEATGDVVMTPVREPEPRQSETAPLDTLFLGDCRDFLRTLPDRCVDLVTSSPPLRYAVVERRGKGSENRLFNRNRQYEARRALQVYLEEQRLVLAECARVLKETGSLFWQVGTFSDAGGLIPLDIRFFPLLESLGLIPRNRIVLAKQAGSRAKNTFPSRHATILWFTKSDEYVFHQQDSCHPDDQFQGDIWVFTDVTHGHEEQTIHPCQFPEELIARIVLLTTNEGGVVVDPYMGAGTAAVVARDLKRHFMGAEINPKYHAVALRRLSGEPDVNRCFPNLKTLRNYIKRTGEAMEGFSVDVQVVGI
jgi:adenine-specific DNA-methyltransferase